MRCGVMSRAGEYGAGLKAWCLYVSEVWMACERVLIRCWMACEGFLSDAGWRVRGFLSDVGWRVIGFLSDVGWRVKVFWFLEPSTLAPAEYVPYDLPVSCPGASRLVN